MIVKFYDKVEDSMLKFAVIVSKSNGKWVFCKHKERDIYECPGGHRESGKILMIPQSVSYTKKQEQRSIL